jgi:sulfite dehydrogenase
VRLAAGTHVLASRATDAAGHAQPAEREENIRGYNNNSWRDHAVTVTVV